jgi:hypothetical protein
VVMEFPRSICRTIDDASFTRSGYLLSTVWNKGRGRLRKKRSCVEGKKEEKKKGGGGGGGREEVAIDGNRGKG